MAPYPFFLMSQATIAAALSGVQCVPICFETRTLSEEQFNTIMLDYLLTITGQSLSSLTSFQINGASDTALCTLQDRTAFYNIPPEKMRAIILYLVSGLLG